MGILPACMLAYYVSRTGVINGCRSPCGCWGLDLDLEEQSVLLAAELLLQPPKLIFSLAYKLMGFIMAFSYVCVLHCSDLYTLPYCPPHACFTFNKDP